MQGLRIVRWLTRFRWAFERRKDGMAIERKVERKEVWRGRIDESTFT